MQLQVLSAVHCSLGPKAGTAAAKLLKVKECSLTQLNLAHCSSMGAVSTCCAAISDINLQPTAAVTCCLMCPRQDTAHDVYLHCIVLSCRPH
jgi:hypothetical protein